MRIKDSPKVQKACEVLIYSFFSLYVFSLPSFSSRSHWNIISYVFLACLAFCVIGAFILFKKPFSLQKRLLVVPLFVLFALVGTALHSKEYRRWLTLVLLTVSFFVFYLSFLANNNERRFLRLIVLSLFAFCLYFAFVYRSDLLNLPQTISSGKRLGDYFDNVNTIGAYMSLGAVLSGFLLINRRRKIDFAVIPALLAFLAVGFLTGSRTFLVSIGLSAVCLLLIKFRHLKWKFVFVGIGVVILSIVVLNLPAFSSLRFKMLQAIRTVFDIQDSSIPFDGSTLQRTTWQKYGFYLWSTNPFFGYGANGFAIYSGVGTYTHGNLSECLCDFGLFGTVAFLSAFIIPLVSAFYSRGADRSLVCAIIPYYFLNLFLSVFYYDKVVYLIFALLFFLTRDVTIRPKWKRVPLETAYKIGE